MGGVCPGGREGRDAGDTVCPGKRRAGLRSHVHLTPVGAWAVRQSVEVREALPWGSVSELCPSCARRVAYFLAAPVLKLLRQISTTLGLQIIGASSHSLGGPESDIRGPTGPLSPHRHVFPTQIRANPPSQPVALGAAPPLGQEPCDLPSGL